MLVVFLFSFEVMLWGWDIFFDSFERGRTTGSLMNLPIWITELAVPFGFAILCIQCVVEFVRVARNGAPDVDIAHE